MEKERIAREAIIQENRHNELTKALKSVTTAISSNKDAEILKALEGQPKVIKDAISEVIKSLPKPEKPEINVGVNNSEIVTLIEKALDKVVERIENSNKELMNRPMVHSFKVVNSGWNGQEKTIDVIYKPANQVTIKK